MDPAIPNGWERNPSNTDLHAMDYIGWRLAPRIETLFLTPAEQYSYISSSLVKEIAALGGDVTDFVHEKVRAALNRRMR